MSSRYQASLCFSVFAVSGWAGAIGGFAYQPELAAPAEQSALHYALQQYEQSLFHDLLDSASGTPSTELLDDASRSGYSVTAAQARTIRLFSGDGNEPDQVRELTDLVSPSSELSSATGETSTTDAVGAGTLQEGSDAGGGVMSLYAAGFSTIDIVEYELSKPWLSTIALTGTALSVLLIVIVRKTFSSPPAL